MRILLIVALLANAFISTSCPMYYPLVQKEGEMISREVSPLCTTAVDDEVVATDYIPCAGGQCIEIRPNKEDAPQLLPFEPLIAVHMPAAGINSVSYSVDSYVYNQPRAIPNIIPVDTIVLRC